MRAVRPPTKKKNSEFMVYFIWKVLHSVLGFFSLSKTSIFGARHDEFRLLQKYVFALSFFLGFHRFALYSSSVLVHFVFIDYSNTKNDIIVIFRVRFLYQRLFLPIWVLFFGLFCNTDKRLLSIKNPFFCFITSTSFSITPIYEMEYLIKFWKSIKSRTFSF